MSHRLNLCVQYACERAGLPARAQFFAWARAACAGGGALTIRLVTPEESQRLNRDYRGKDCATNVLSFAYATEPSLCGDLVLCPAIVALEAEAQGKTPEAHYAHLTVHGILHLQGQDHGTARAAAAMERDERDILAILGYPDPYL
ncbi:MAG: rRNA maturation RNase YbeY [Zoogloeaceae bacterium]|nr:rRNA maturation RNase YbeY [Zoogloeaceae bacterium]